MRKPSKGQPARRPSQTRPAQLITELLRDGLTVTVGGVPIQITLGDAGAVQAAAPRPAAKVSAVAPKPRRKPRRRKARRVVAPDPRDIRGYLATQMEGSTLTALAHHFGVKRPLIKRMLRRMLDREEVTLFKGAFFNNKRLRQRRITSKYAEATAPATRAARPQDDAAPPLEASPEAPPEVVAPVAGVAEQLPKGPTAVPDSEREEPQDPSALPYPERDAA